MADKGNEGILTDTVLHNWHVHQLKSVMIDCKISNVSKDAVNISDKCVFRGNLIYILKLDILTVNIAETERTKRADLKVEEVKTGKRI